MHGCTGSQTRILSDARTMLTSAITSHNGNHRFGIGYRHSQQVGYFSHGLGTAYRTKESVKASGIGSLDKSVGHTATSRESTSATIGTRQQFTHLRNTGILIDSKFLGGGKQHDGCYQADGSQDNHCNQDEIHKYLFI
jgi:hypothetical protein